MTPAAVTFRSDDPRMDAARQIRAAVFCREQGISPADEWDDQDPVCEHFLLTAGQTPIGTARVRPYGEDRFKIERMAVLKEHRGAGAGRFLMRAILMHMAARTATLVLNAQTAVEGFYRKLGFEPEGAVFTEAGIPHIRMALRPTLPPSP